MNFGIFGLLDIIFLVLVLLSTLIGIKRGLLKSLTGVLGFFSQIVIAFSFAVPVSNFFKNNNFIWPQLQEVIKNEWVTNILIIVISFLIIFIAVFILVIIIKRLINILRENKFIRVIDTILGAVFNIVLMVAIYFVFLLIVSYIMKSNFEFLSSFKNFINIDLALDKENIFRISKWLYNNNPLLLIILK